MNNATKQDFIRIGTLDHPDIGALLHKYLKGRAEVPTETRLRIIRLIENMTLGRNAVGYLTESVHGAGSPQAQRVQIARGMQLDYRKRLARILAGIEDVEDSTALADELTGYFAEVFRTEDALAMTESSAAGGDRR